MRSPLNALIGTADMLAQGVYGELTPKQEHAVERIQRNNRRLLALLDDAMTYIRISADNWELSPHPFDPHGLLNEIVSDVGPIAKEREVSLNIQTNENVPANLIGDAAQIKRIVLALMWNAIAAGKSETVWIDSNWSSSSGWVLVVRDTGAGIPTESVPHIFEPFWSSGESIKSGSSSGFGLGLSVAKSLAELRNGRVVLNETGSAGTTFELYLPLVLAT
jgi:signal transduction histidine kinase